MAGDVCIYFSRVKSAAAIYGDIWRAKNVDQDRVRRIAFTMPAEIVGLINRAITGGRYGSASEYVRALIVRERVESGDKSARRVNLEVRRGRPKAA